MDLLHHLLLLMPSTLLLLVIVVVEVIHAAVLMGVEGVVAVVLPIASSAEQMVIMLRLTPPFLHMLLNTLMHLNHDSLRRCRRRPINMRRKMSFEEDAMSRPNTTSTTEYVTLQLHVIVEYEQFNPEKKTDICNDINNESNADMCKEFSNVLYVLYSLLGIRLNSNLSLLELRVDSGILISLPKVFVDGFARADGGIYEEMFSRNMIGFKIHKQ
ncbi:hypothetical protein L2E82_50581 [Cichorium intybus]|nr:hypothetical protein L2E82_50581 [Cichorium intybus]